MLLKTGTEVNHTVYNISVVTSILLIYNTFSDQNLYTEQASNRTTLNLYSNSALGIASYCIATYIA